MKRLFVLLLSLSMLLLVGCSADSLLDSEDVIDMVERVVPSAEFVSLEHKESNTEFGRNLYVFDNGEFEFSYENYMTTDSIFGWNRNPTRHNYLYNLISHFYLDIQEIAANNNIYLMCDSIEKKEYLTNEEIYNLMIENLDKVFIQVRVRNMDTYDSGLSFKVYLDDYSQIESSYDFINEFYAFLKPYFPSNENKKFTLDFNYNFYTKDTMLETDDRHPWSLLNIDMVLLSKEVDLELEKEWLKHCFAYNVRQGNIDDMVLSYTESLNYCPIYIDTLYINGNLFELPNDFDFFYNIEDGRYYAKVFCGSDEGEDAEFVQKSILEYLYGDIGYVIDKDRDFSSYMINGDTYKIRRMYFDSSFEFTKNGTDLEISNYDNFIYRPYGTSSSQYISIEDFSYILGLRVDNIDTINGIVYLKSLK